jgi:hypothetical protein
MKRHGTFIGLALAFAIGLFLAFRMHHVGEHEPANQIALSGEHNGQGFLLVPQRLEPLKPSVDVRSGAGSQPGLRLDDQQRSEADPVTVAESALQAQPRPQAGAPSPDTDFSVVGHPFPASESILAACGKANPQRSCEPNKKLLADMAQEPREEPWATLAERAIRALVELEPGTERPREVTYTIRALECRTSICFVETASIMGAFTTQLYYFEKSNGLTAQYSIDSSETDPYGNKVHVTLWPFVRN